jgi:hypothetical protein
VTDRHAGIDYEQQRGRVDAYRVLEALGHIGYTPVSAIFDIVDNAVAADATRVDIAFDLEPGIAETRRNNVHRYIIADNGKGMDRDGLDNALQLGSQISLKPHSLGKFGMGLKSAALSQGNLLTLLSKTIDSDLEKAVLDVDLVRESGEYMLMFGGVTNEDRVTWEQYLAEAPSGTVVVIDRIHKVNHPSARNTREELHRQIGVYYYYFIVENGLEVRLDGEAATGVDPLFIEEADQHDQLDPSAWDGSTVCWSLRPSKVTLDSERNVKATVSATQLPHPFTFGEDRTAIRRQYMIGPGNYGFYVYRNKRLISWADRFDQIIPYAQEYWSFRGRILIADDADEVLNIDVKKSRVLLNEEALQALTDVTYDLRLKSRNAWENAFRLYKERLGASAGQVADEILNEVDFPDALPTDPDDSKTEEERERRSARQAQRKPMNPEEKEDLRQRGQRVQFVPFLDDNVLWERAHDAELGTVVRVNRGHRFVRDVFGHFQNDALVMTVLKGTFLGLAQSEGHAVRAIQDLPDEDLERIFLRFREIASQVFGQIATDAIEKALERSPE